MTTTTKKKYEFTGETKTLDGSVLQQIRRLSDGLLGGWIESESNLSHEGDCFVYENAWVSGNAQIYGNALVFGNAQVSENAVVCGSAWVYGKAWVYEDVVVCGDARVYGNAWVSGNMVVCGKMWYDPDTNKTTDNWSVKEVLMFEVYNNP